MYFKIFRFITFVLVFVTPDHQLYAQQVAPYDTILVLIHKTKEKQKFIKTGKNISFWTKDNHRKNKGRIERITENSLIIDGETYYFDSLVKIGAKSTGLKIVQATGKVLLISGVLLSGYGGYMIVYGYSIADSEACEAIVSIIIGFTIMAVGIPVAVVGAVPLAIVGQRFDLEKKWDLKTEVVKNKKFERQQKREEKKNHSSS